MKLISTTGVIASKNNCPAAGQFLYSSCATVQAVDAAGNSFAVGAPAQVYTDGNCGTTENVGSPIEGQCGFPPNGWAVSYYPLYLTVDPIYWSHPSNPLAGQLAFAGGQYIYTYSITTYTNYPETYSTGWVRNDQDLLQEITGLDGWRIQIRFTAWSNYYLYAAIEDDLTP